MRYVVHRKMIGYTGIGGQRVKVLALAAIGALPGELVVKAANMGEGVSDLGRVIRTKVAFGKASRIEAFGVEVLRYAHGMVHSIDIKADGIKR